ncbi:hypothetical protein PARMER_03790 [Parabacteroides merdae ATCC 43184]|nr:hypothetical protein PARMER_03790 [Parabacteroides merdae ATCC 43184]
MLVQFIKDKIVNHDRRLCLFQETACRTYIFDNEMTDGKDNLPVVFGKDPAMFDVAKRDRDEIESGHEFMIYDL